LQSSTVASFGMFDGFRDRAGDERLRRRQHADVALDREIALPILPHGLAQSNTL